MSTASVSFAPPPAGPAIPPAELERLYRIRMSLPADQRDEVERQYDAHLAGNPPNRAPTAAARPAGDSSDYIRELIAGIPIEAPDMPLVTMPRNESRPPELPQEDMTLLEDEPAVAPKAPPARPRPASPATAPSLAELDAELRRNGLNGVPQWYMDAMTDPSVTHIGGRPKGESTIFSPQAKESAIERQYRAAGMTNMPAPSAPPAAPARPPAARPPVARSRPAPARPAAPPRGPESLDPVEAAGFDVQPDPEVGADVSGYADRPAYSPESLERAANLPPDAGPSGYADRSPAYSERNLGRAARGPMPQPRVLQSDVESRTRELVGRGIDPESARAIAESEISSPQNPNDPNPTTPAKRAAIKANVARFNEERAAAQRQAEADWYESNFGESDRLNKELSDARLRGSPDARLHMPETADWRPETAADRKKWKDWTTGGSLDRMARYAPEEFDRRWDEAAADRKKDNASERAKRYDTTMDADSGKTRGQLYREKQQAADYNRLRKTDVPQNLKLYRELAAMGIDPDRFGDPRSQFDRDAALNAKTKARQSGVIGKDANGNQIPVGGREGAVARRAQMRQNPMEFLRRPDVTDDQRQAMTALLLGRGATPNDVAAMQAKMFLEGLQQGARQNVNVNTPELQQAQADAVRTKLDQDRRTMREPDEDVLGEKYAPAGYFGYNEFTVAEQQQMYDDLIAQGYTPAEAQRAVDRQATKRRASDRSWKPPAPKGK